MSPVPEVERRARSKQYMPKYFPGATPAQIQEVEILAITQFYEDLSPDRREQLHRLASGTGVSFEDFVIFLGRLVTRRDPVGVTPERLHKILVGVLSI